MFILVTELVFNYWKIHKVQSLVEISGGARPGPAGARAPAEKACAPADEVGQN